MAVDVLLIDDEHDLAEATADYLRAFDLTVRTESSAEAGLRAVREEPPGVILLDVNLPGMNGFAFCRRLREHHDVPILFLSARTGDDDQILALTVGGDDYITKPFSLGVLLAKVRRALARSGIPDDGYDDGRLRVDATTGRTWLDGAELTLPAMEDRLLRCLVARAGQVVTKQEIFDEVWGEPFTSEGTLTVHIRRLRQRIEVDPDRPRYVKTVWGRGYLFEARP
ncbi:MAG TPA: response regulator transcription factor [Phycicoccus sp.]|nr:response regulator transcription factor [Phycicoccus sp.]